MERATAAILRGWLLVLLAPGVPRLLLLLACALKVRFRLHAVMPRHHRGDLRQQAAEGGEEEDLAAENGAAQ